MKITCDKCRGRGELDVDDAEAPCEVELVLGHETLHCFASRKHPGQPHMAILCDPCSACGAYEEHHETCGVYEMEPFPPDTSSWWLWQDSALAPSRAAEGQGQAWRDVYQPDSPWATHNRKAA